MERVECFRIELTKYRKHLGEYFALEVIFQNLETEVWITHPKVGIKSFIYGAMTSDFVICWDHIKDAIENYIEEYVDEYLDEILEERKNEN